MALIACASQLGAQTRVSPGQMLVATDRLNDPEFSKSVVLILAADARGVQGVWINRPTTVPVSTLFPALKTAAAAYQGGPLRLGINGLVRSSRQLANGTRLFGDVWLVVDRAALESLASGGGANVRIYVGTCGWSVPQLDDEVRRRGAWTILPPSADAVFDADLGTLWNRLAGVNVARAGFSRSTREPSSVWLARRAESTIGRAPF